MNMIPPSTMRLSEVVNYYGSNAVPVDTLIVSLEKLEAIEDDAPEVADLQQEVQKLNDKIDSLEKEIESIEDELTNANRQIDSLQNELLAVQEID